MKQKLINFKNKVIEKWKYIDKNKYYLLLGFIIIPFVISYIIHNKEYSDARQKVRRRLKHFNPTIKQGVFGEYVEWTGREKPLTDEEVEELMKS